MSIKERRAEEKQLRRESIIDAGEAAFAEKGFDRTTMADVARHARLSRALLYVYFHDKEDLLVAVTVRALRSLRERFEAAASESGTGLYHLRSIGRAYASFSQEEPVYFDAISRLEIPEESDALSAHRDCATEGNQLFEVMVRAIENGKADGSIRKDVGNPLQLAVVLWAHIHGIMTVGESQKSVLDKYGVNRDDLLEMSLWMLKGGLETR